MPAYGDDLAGHGPSPGGWTRSGSRPVVFPVILAFSAVESANGDLPEAAWRRETPGGVHGERDMVLHRPLTPGESLDMWTRISAVRTVQGGNQVVLHIEQFDADGRIAVKQWWTEVLLKCMDGRPRVTARRSPFPGTGTRQQHSSRELPRRRVRHRRRSFAFEATCRGMNTISHGRLELRT